MIRGVYMFPEIFGIKFQIIHIYNQEHLIDYINRSYDMDFCKNIFDGSILHVLCPNSIRYGTTNVSKLDSPRLKLSRFKYIT